MIVWSRIKMPILVVMPTYKGWFKGLGLHHASLALIPLSIALLCAYLGKPELGAFITAMGMWHYASREYGNGPYPPKSFEVMDFVSPAIISLSYFWLKGLIQ